MRMGYEEKLITVVGSVFVGAIPFVVGALRDKIAAGLVGLFLSVAVNKLIGLWVAIPFSIVAAAVIYFRGAPEMPHFFRKGTEQNTTEDKDEQTR